MNGFLSGIQKFFNKDRLLILGIFLCLGIFLMSYSNGKLLIMDNMDAPEPEKVKIPQRDTPENLPGYSSKAVANPGDLLPHDTNSQWASLNPVSQNNPQLPDLLQAGYHIGLDTIGNTLRNANYQLRSDPMIRKSEVGPWNQSTIEPDLMRVPLEVGQSAP